jgi:hypothetical protein
MARIFKDPRTRVPRPRRTYIYRPRAPGSRLERKHEGFPGIPGKRHAYSRPCVPGGRPRGGLGPEGTIGGAARIYYPRGGLGPEGTIGGAARIYLTTLRTLGRPAPRI